MNITKKDICSKINKNTELSMIDATLILNSFIEKIKVNSNNSIIVKVTNFGTFQYKKSPLRVGRNPKTKEKYIIKDRLKLKFYPSSHIRRGVN